LFLHLDRPRRTIIPELSLGRFYSEEAVGTCGGPNQYDFGGNDPIDGRRPERNVRPLVSRLGSI